MSKIVKWLVGIFIAVGAVLALSLVIDSTPGTGIIENEPTSNEPTKTVEVFFNNSRLDPEFSCYKVFPVTRVVPSGQDEKLYAIAQLLAGPTEEDKLAQYDTSLNPGTTLRSLRVADRTAYADFDKQLDFQVGGSCRVGAIRAQITETLKQFAEVDEVVISIQGETEEILQP